MAEQLASLAFLGNSEAVQPCSVVISFCLLSKLWSLGGVRGTNSRVNRSIPVIRLFDPYERQYGLPKGLRMHKFQDAGMAISRWETFLRSGQTALRDQKFEEAQHFFILAAQQIQWLNLDDWRLLETTCWISMCAIQRGDKRHAENLLQKLLVVLFQKWTAESPEMLAMLQDIADLCEDENRFLEAARLMLGLLEFHPMHCARKETEDYLWVRDKYKQVITPLNTIEVDTPACS